MKHRNDCNQYWRDTRNDFLLQTGSWTFRSFKIPIWRRVSFWLKPELCRSFEVKIILWNLIRWGNPWEVLHGPIPWLDSGACCGVSVPLPGVGSPRHADSLDDCYYERAGAARSGGGGGVPFVRREFFRDLHRQIIDFGSTLHRCNYRWYHRSGWFTTQTPRGPVTILGRPFLRPSSPSLGSGLNFSLGPGRFFPPDNASATRRKGVFTTNNFVTNSGRVELLRK